MARAQSDDETASAVADRAYDLWEQATPGSTLWDERKQDAQAKGDAATRACLLHIKMVGALQECHRVLTVLEDPQELERRVSVAEAHEEWWRSRR